MLCLSGFEQYSRWVPLSFSFVSLGVIGRAVSLEICVSTDVFCANTSWHGIFPWLSENSKAGLSSRNVLRSACSFRLCKRIVKASPLSYIWRKYIMFDLKSVKVFMRNLRRRIASYPKELWLVFGVTIVFLACFLIYSLTFYNPGQKSSELKGRYGKH